MGSCDSEKELKLNTEMEMEPEWGDGYESDCMNRPAEADVLRRQQNRATIASSTRHESHDGETIKRATRSVAGSEDDR